MNPILVEVIAASAADCQTIEKAGADRIELVSGFELGGLTPSLGLMREARKATKLPIVAMVRPRASGFCYSKSEQAAIRHDVSAMFAEGADAVITGALTDQGAIDVSFWELLHDLGPLVCHRCFDYVAAPFEALESLAELGVQRVLTSGRCATAKEGVQMLAELRVVAGEKLEILMAGGIRPENALEILKRTGLRSLHASAMDQIDDRPDSAPKGVDYGSYSHVSEAKVRALVNAVRP